MDDNKMLVPILSLLAIVVLAVIAAVYFEDVTQTDLETCMELCPSYYTTDTMIRVGCDTTCINAFALNRTNENMTISASATVHS